MTWVRNAIYEFESMFDCILYSKRTFFSMIGELLVFVYVLKYYVSFVDELCECNFLL